MAVRWIHLNEPFVFCRVGKGRERVGVHKIEQARLQAAIVMEFCVQKVRFVVNTFSDN